MRCKVTGKPLSAIWKHPDLDGQLVAALTRFNAWALVKAITGKDLDESKFSRTGLFARRERVLSTFDAQVEATVKPKDMKE